LVQRLAVVHERRDDRYFLTGELERERVLLADRIAAPAPGTIELRDHEAAACTRPIHTYLIDAVLVAREPEDAAARLEADPLDGGRDHVGRESLVWDLVARRAARRLAAFAHREPRREAPVPPCSAAIGAPAASSEALNTTSASPSSRARGNVSRVSAA